ncbi:hypothetical protein BLNAU_22309 [Blattamonas nauphoetae]|uniref:Uncharacterized protein n=1 Tax=Blattamonas nauphoetae TaxID=2049346 RepID=A0ABQ9WWJ4_9EUKA|nr:hypothetical protein BLNAU_22309 [Blattamonas nauphoetae]
MGIVDSKISSSTDSPCPDCSAFLNWNEAKHASERKQAVIFRSLVATLKSQPALDVDLEAKAVKLLESAIIEAAMKMVGTLAIFSSTKVQLALSKADLIPQLIITLNPLSLSFTKAVHIHTNFMETINRTVWPGTPDDLARLGIEDGNEQQAVHETVLQQVIVPSEKYICHLCMNRFSIIDGGLLDTFLELLARLLRISPYYQPTMDFVLNMPVTLTIPSCLAFCELEYSILCFLSEMVYAQRERNTQRVEVRQMWKTMHRMLRMEGIEDM